MKLQQCILLLLSFFVMTECKSPSDQIKDAFTKVDRSLESSNEVLNNSLENIYKQINLKRDNNQSLAAKTDTIYFEAVSTIKFLDSLKKVMLQKDTTGTNPDLAAKLLFNTKAGDDFREKLLNVYNVSYATHSSNKIIIDSTLKTFREIQSDEGWVKKYFDKTPTLAAVAILTKLKNDCVNATAITLKDINQKQKE